MNGPGPDVLPNGKSQRDTWKLSPSQGSGMDKQCIKDKNQNQCATISTQDQGFQNYSLLGLHELLFSFLNISPKNG